MSQAIELFEIDLPYCSLTYGVAPCTAAFVGGFKAALSYSFLSSQVHGFTAAGATAVGSATGLLFTATATDPMLRTPAVSFSGSANRLIRIELVRTAVRPGGSWQGVVYYSHAGHTESASFHKTFAEVPNVVGAHAIITIDMATLTAGGSDWISNTITGVRFDFDDGVAGGAFRILSIGIGHVATEAEATGTAKCFNTLATCQDTAHIDLDPQTIRFAKAADYLPRDIDALPWITALEFTPSTVSLGETLGSRASLKVTFSDHQHSDVGAGFDKYVAERGYDPYMRGSFWPRFRARFASLQGVRCRWRIGFAGDALGDYESRTFFVESFEGPHANGSFAITAKDALKFLDGDRAQAPELSTGALQAALSASATSFTLVPAGVGNDEYPTAGYVRLGGREDVSFSRTNDVMNIGRGALGTTSSAHNAGDRVQIVLRYGSADPATIAHNVLTEFTDLPAGYIDLTAWQAETAANLDTLYTFTIGEPTPVKTILDRLVEQAGLAIWDDPVAGQLRLKVIQSVPVTATTVDESNVIAKTFDQTDQPAKRVSQAWVYFSPNDPTKKHDDIDNYRSVVKVEDIASEALYRQEAIRKVFASGIATGGATIAARIGGIIVGRFKRPPRRLKFTALRGSPLPELGAGCNIEWHSLQDASGARETVPAQVVRVKPGAALLEIEAEEMHYAYVGGPTNIHTITFDYNSYSVNIRNQHDVLYGPPTAGDRVICYINPNVTMGATSPDSYAVYTGSFPGGVQVNVIIRGRVQGCGGGGGGTGGSNGRTGGGALLVQTPINLVVTGGQLWGGGGGGGAFRFTVDDTWGNGGGGAGTNGGPAGGYNYQGTPSPVGQPGTWEAGGIGFRQQGVAGSGAGSGGGPGAAGSAAFGFSAPNYSLYGGGAPGAAVTGSSNRTWGTWNASTLTFTPGGGGADGDVRGPQI